MKKHLCLLAVLLAVFAAGCGGGGGAASGAPAISLIEDALDNDLTSVTTGIFPTSFTAAFDHEIDLASAQAAGAITMTCGTLSAVLSVAQGGSNNDLEITVTDPWKYALMTCTLTFTTAVKSLDGTPMAADESYVFTNACAVNDDFNADSSGCWNSYEGAPLVEVPWTDLAAWLSIDTATSSLNADFASVSSETRVSLQKVAGVSQDGFEIEVKIENPNGIINTGSPWPSVFAAVIGDNATIGAIENELVIGIVANPGTHEMYCGILAITVPNTYVAVYGTACNDPTKTYYIRYSTLSGTASRQYKFEGAEYADLPPIDGTWPSWSFPGEGNSSLEMFFNAFGGESGNIGHIYTQGITVTGQY